MMKYKKKSTGYLKDFHSIGMNDQWGIIFQWEDDDALNVGLVHPTGETHFWVGKCAAVGKLSAD